MNSCLNGILERKNNSKYDVTSTQLNQHEKVKLKKLLKYYQKSVLPGDKYGVGKCSLGHYSIKTDDEKPVPSPCYRLPTALQDEALRQID